MLFRLKRFNPYLVVPLLVRLLGCQSEWRKSREQLTALRVHIEVNSSDTNRFQTVSVFREQPFPLKVEKVPFVTESEVSEAKIVPAVGGFSIRIQFGRQGTWLLEQ